MAHALIGVHGRVIDVATTPFDVPGGHEWVDLEGHEQAPEHGWQYHKGKFSPPRAPELTLSQKAIAALRAGVEIKSKKTPEIDGLYAIDPPMLARITRIGLYTQVSKKFPGGSGEFDWRDRTGNSHRFPSVAVWHAFMAAVFERAETLEAIVETGEGELPPVAVEIP